MTQVFNNSMEKYVAQALEGYEQNYSGISEAITKMEAQLETFKEQREQMKEGIDEMRELLGLEEEPEETKSMARLINDGAPVDME